MIPSRRVVLSVSNLEKKEMRSLGRDAGLLPPIWIVLWVEGVVFISTYTLWTCWKGIPKTCMTFVCVCVCPAVRLSIQEGSSQLPAYWWWWCGCRLWETKSAARRRWQWYAEDREPDEGFCRLEHLKKHSEATLLFSQSIYTCKNANQCDHNCTFYLNITIICPVMPAHWTSLNGHQTQGQWNINDLYCSLEATWYVPLMYCISECVLYISYRCINPGRWVVSWQWTGCVLVSGLVSVLDCWEWMEPGRPPPSRCWQVMSVLLEERPSLMETGQCQKNETSI